MCDSHESTAEICGESALAYLEMGWSVIPLWGDARPERAKTPAVAWAQYQQAPPDADTVRAWFAGGRCAGVGVVCGPVSGLVVLDFDDPALAQTFARLNPDLTNTLTVRSGGRGLPHYYYALPPGLPAQTSRAPGVDLLAAGSYVVAPPTACAGRAWEVEHDGPLRRLTALDLRRVAAFIAAQRAAASPADVPHDLLFVEPSGALSLAAVQRWYGRLAQAHGRNAALYRAASYLRDAGWAQPQTAQALELLHAGAPPTRPHAPETPAQRLREARATIASAYRRAPLRGVVRAGAQGLLPNAVRERLLQTGQAAAARVLEGLRAAGVSAGQLFTEKLACRLLRAYGIGRRAVQAALGLPLFARAEASQRQRKQHNRQKKCFFVSGANRVRSSHSQAAGRPPVWFIMPDNGALYRALAARPSGADALPAACLASPRLYREALHRALIARRPGRYSRRWLSQRLGVSVWTSRRYDRAAGLAAVPSYQEQPLHWGNLGLVAPEADPGGPDGTFLLAADGRRYPPLRSIALRLLGRGQRVSLLRQGWNAYYLEFNGAGIQAQDTQARAPACDRPPLPAAAASAPPAGLPPVISPFAAAPPAAPPERFLWLCPDCLRVRLGETAPAACRCGQRARWERYPEALWRDTGRLGVWYGARRQRHHADQRARRAGAGQGAAGAPGHTLAAQRDEWVARLKSSPFARYFANAHQFMGAPDAGHTSD